MKASKAMLNERGQVIVTLSEGTQVTLRQPKGRDLKAIELSATATDKTSVGTMMLIVSLLSVEPKLTLDEVEDMEAEDIKLLGDALSNFSVFRNVG